MAQIAENSLLKTQLILQILPSSQIAQLGIQSLLQAQHEKKIKFLELKIQKKNQLIKYLQKKCGHQIIKSTKKFQDKINQLEAQNSSLRKIIQFFGFSQDSKHSLLNLSGSETNLDSTISYIDSNIQNIRRNKRFRFNGSKQDFLNMTNEQLKQIIILQALEIKNFYKQNQFCSSSWVKNKNKNLTHSSSKKNSMVFSLAQTSVQDSNQNLNHVNLLALTQKTSLNINTQNISLKISQIQKKSSPNLLNRANEQTKQMCTQTQALSLDDKNYGTQNLIEMTQISTQSDCVEYKNFNTQTEETHEDVQNMMKYLQILKKQNRNLLNQIEQTKNENNGLKGQVDSFSQKIQDYCLQLLKQSSQFSELDKTQGKNNTNLFFNSMLDNYNEVLQIFCLQPIQSDELQNKLEYSQRKLINQITHMKLQISHIIKQFKKIQRQLHDNFYQKNHLQVEIKRLKQMLSEVEQYNEQITALLQSSNLEIMKLRNKQIQWKLMKKIKFEQCDTQITPQKASQTNEEHIEQALQQF